MNLADTFLQARTFLSLSQSFRGTKFYLRWTLCFNFLHIWDPDSHHDLFSSAVQDQQRGQCYGCYSVSDRNAISLSSFVSGLQLFWRWVMSQATKEWRKRKLICISIEFNFIFRAVCHSTLKCRVCLLKAITLISPASGSQCFNDVLYSLPLLLLVHNEVKTLSILLMYITRWNVNFLQLPGMCSFSSTAVWLPYFA